MWMVAMVVLALSAVLPAVRAQEDAGPTVEVRGIRLVGEAYGDEWRGLRAFNWSPGTSLALLVQLPDGGIIDLDEENSEIEKMVDDKGTDLLEGGRFGNTGFSFSNVAEDSSAVMTTLKGPQVPAEGAVSITASGTLVLQTASKQNTERSEDMALEKGAKPEPGPYKWEVVEVKPADGQDGFMFTLRTNQDLGAVKEIVFEDPDGNKLEVQSRGMWSMQGTERRVDSHYYVKEKPEKFRMKVTFWVDMKATKVPFDVTTGLGLGE
jgi:hypothetical protein